MKRFIIKSIVIINSLLLIFATYEFISEAYRWYFSPPIDERLVFAPYVFVIGAVLSISAFLGLVTGRPAGLDIVIFANCTYALLAVIPDLYVEIFMVEGWYYGQGELNISASIKLLFALILFGISFVIYKYKYYISAPNRFSMSD